MSAVAVVADNVGGQAKTAPRRACPSSGTRARTRRLSSASIAAMLKEGPRRRIQAFVAKPERWTSRPAIAGAAKKIESRLRLFRSRNHAPMEPMNATAKYTADRCEVWVADAEWRGRVSRRRWRRPDCRPTSARSTRSIPAVGFGPARGPPRLRHPGRPDRQADVWDAG